MDFQPSEDEALFVDSVRGFCRERVVEHAASWDDAGQVPAAILHELGALGLLGMQIDEAAGGSGLSTLAAAAVIEELATASASLALVVSAHNFLAVAHVARCGQQRVREDVLPDLVSGRHLGAWALSEHGSGSDALAAETTARRDGDRWILAGTKAYVTAGAHAQRIIVFARTDADRSLTAFVVDADTEGLKVQARVRSLGVRAAALAHLQLHDVVVADDRRLGGVGTAFADARALLDHSRIGIAALTCGIGRAALTQASAYARERRQFGRPIAQFQAIQFKLSDMAVALDAAGLLTRRAAWLADTGRPFAAAASRAKLFAADAVQRICSEALQIHGGYGYTREFAVERLLRDAKAMQIAEGTGQIQRLLLARQIADTLTR